MVIRSSGYHDIYLMQTTIRPLSYNSYREHRYNRSDSHDVLRCMTRRDKNNLQKITSSMFLDKRTEFQKSTLSRLFFRVHLNFDVDVNMIVLPITTINNKKNFNHILRKIFILN